MNSIKNLIIYGCGKCGKSYTDKCIANGVEKSKILLTDSDSRLWGTRYRDLEIHSPDEVFENGVDIVVVAVGGKFKEELRSQLIEKYHIADKKIVLHTKTLMIPSCNIYDMDNIFLMDIDEDTYGMPQYYDMWYELYKMALKGMNVGAGGGYDTSGELNVIEWLKTFGRNNKVIFDVGANIGGYTKALLSVFPEARIYCFEPAKETFRTLSNNIVEQNVTLNNMGISDEIASKTLYFDKENSGLASLYHRQLDYIGGGVEFNKQEQVELVTLDYYCQKNDIDEIDFLKMDIEGNEYKALLGASDLIKKKKIGVIQIETGGTNMDSRTYFRDYWKLLHEDFEVFRILQDGLKKIEKYEEELECFITTNWLFVQKPKEKDHK